MDDLEARRPSPGALLYDLRVELLAAAAAFYQVLSIGFTLLQASQFGAVFASMNVDLPPMTWAAMVAAEALSAYWFLVLPLVAWASVRLFLVTPFTVAARASTAGPEERKLIRFSLVAALLGAVLGLACVDWVVKGAVYLPMLKLVNNVG